MKKTRILIIGKSEWVSEAKGALSSNNDSYAIETVENEEDAVARLSHNSYDILIIHDRFSNLNSLELASLAYAMTRPTIVVCSGIFSFLHYSFWHHFSIFSNKFKTSKKLINFNYRFKGIRKTDNQINSKLYAIF